MRTNLGEAALFWYLNRTGYKGLCRFNQAGEAVRSRHLPIV